MTQGQVQIDIPLLLQIIGELFVENYARKRGMVIDGDQSVQTGGGGIREGQSAPSENNKVPYESMSTQVSRQDLKR